MLQTTPLCPLHLFQLIETFLSTMLYASCFLNSVQPMFGLLDQLQPLLGLLDQPTGQPVYFMSFENSQVTLSNLFGSDLRKWVWRRPPILGPEIDILEELEELTRAVGQETSPDKWICSIDAQE